MAITWGALQRNLQVGIDVVMSPSSVGAGTTSVTVTVHYYIRAHEAYADDQSMILTGSITGTYGYRLNSSNGTTTDLRVATRSFTVNTSYGGGPTYTFGAYVTGVYNGAQPSHSRSFTIPKRPASAPAAFNGALTQYTNISHDRANAHWGTPANNGSALTAYTLQVGTSSGNPNVVNRDYSPWANSKTITGLQPATTYYARVRAKNAIGYGGFSSWGSFKTAATTPSAPATPTVGDILPSDARVTFAAPSNGGSAITRYEVQVSTNTSYSGAKTFTGTSSPITITDLEPGQKHFVRVRAVNALGAGAWSGSREFTTLSGSAVKIDGIWRAAKTWVKVDGSWRLAKVHKKVNGAWKL